MNADSEEASEESAGKTGWRGPSRSQLKRDADAIADLAEALVRLSEAETAQLSLDADLQDAIAVGRQLNKGARSRQVRRIAKLLRNTDVTSVVAAIRGHSEGRRAAAAVERACERWRARLLDEGDAALDEFLAEHGGPQPEQRRELRRLIRGAKREPSDARSQRAKLTLLRKVRQLTQRTS